MLGLTSLGVVHTAISLVAVASGFVCFVRDRQITAHTAVGKTYIITTILTCLTGFGIFQHGGFNKAHVLGIITLVVLALAFAGGAGKFGKASPYVSTLSYTLTFFFHFVPGITETTTRLPVGAPIFANDQAPGLQAAIGITFLIFLVIMALQVRTLRAQSKSA